MLRMMATAAKAAALLGTVSLIGFTWLPSVSAVSVSSTQLQMTAGKTEAYVNTQKIQLEVPPEILDGHFYLPAKWVSDAFNIQLYWDAASATAHFITPKAYIQFDPAHDEIQVNGTVVPFHTVAEIRNGKLLVKLSWLAAFTHFTYKYMEDSQSVEISNLGEPSTAYKESTLRNDDTLQNSRPIAKFALGKEAYRLGEPIQFIDLSYDPDSEGLPVYEWEGKTEAYFKPGIYPVKLTVRDGKGNVSAPFTRNVNVLNDSFRTEEEYPFYYKPVGTMLSQASISAIPRQSSADISVPVVVRQSDDRMLLRGSSLKPVMEKGFLFHDNVHGRVRLYPQYVNGMAGTGQLVIRIRNLNEDHAVQITTTAAVDSIGSVYTPLLGNKTAEHFLASPLESSQLTVEPGAAIIYKASPGLSSGQGFQGIYDLEADGEVSISYAMVTPGEQPYHLMGYRHITSPDLLKEVIPVSTVAWAVDSRSLKKPIALGIGDGSVEPTLQGKIKGDNEAEAVIAEDESQAGVHYRITVDVSGPTAIAFYPRGGFFQGAIRVNGSLAALPLAGITSNEAILIHRSASTEQQVHIDLLASDLTRLPVDFLIIPLNDKQ